MLKSNKILFGVLFALTAAVGCGCAASLNCAEGGLMNYTDPNNYRGSDIERINAAIRDSRNTGGVVKIFKRKPDAVSERDFWLIDSAILIPGDTALHIVNCKIKLSDKSRDNWIRSANAMPGNPEVNVISRVHIIGEGSAILEGADHPRATGDSGKVLGVQTYGTDAGKANKRQKGDWRNIGILLVKVQDFTLQNLKMINSHSWAVSLEHCRRGIIRDLHFESSENVMIDGKKATILNRDGLDLRKGCRDITIENITGFSGDDLIALTAVGNKPRRPGSMIGSEFFGTDKNPEENHIFNISIRNVRGYCAGGHHVIRFLNNRGVKMYNIQVSNVMDTSPAGVQAKAIVKIGDPCYGGASPLGDTSDFQIVNIHSRAQHAILLGGSLQNSMISNVLNYEPANHPVTRQLGTEETSGLFLNNLQTVGKDGTVIQTQTNTMK